MRLPSRRLRERLHARLTFAKVGFLAIFHRHPPLQVSIGILQVSTANSRTKTVFLKLVLHACRDERNRFGKTHLFVCARQEKAKEQVQQHSRGRGLPVEGGCRPPSVFPEPLVREKLSETDSKVEDESRRKALLCVAILLNAHQRIRFRSGLNRSSSASTLN